MCSKDSPVNLRKVFSLNKDLGKKYQLRNIDLLEVPSKGRFKDYGEFLVNSSTKYVLTS